MNEHDQIQRDDESNSAAESCPKPTIDEPAEPPESVLKIQRTELPSDAIKPSDTPESPVISAGRSANDPRGAHARETLNKASLSTGI
jgi:hypothetical protein